MLPYLTGIEGKSSGGLAKGTVLLLFAGLTLSLLVGSVPAADVAPKAPLIPASLEPTPALAPLTIAQQGGQIVGWGGQTVGGSLNRGFIAVVAGGKQTLGLKLDGSVAAWGACYVPSSSKFLAIAAGRAHGIGLKNDSSIDAWGSNYYGQCNVPSPNSGFVGIVAGNGHSLGLKRDGSIVAWGDNASGQCDVPSPNSDFVALTAGRDHSLALRACLKTLFDRLFSQDEAYAPSD